MKHLHVALMHILLAFHVRHLVAQAITDNVTGLTTDVFDIGLGNISTLPDLIPNWYNYLYDGGDGFIQDGGGDMYDRGNNIIVYRNEIETIRVIYNQTYVFEDYSFTSAAIHPFIAWLHVSNPAQERLNFTIRVLGNAGADGGGNIIRYNGSINQGNYSCQYFVFQVGNTEDPSICEVYALLQNPEDWGSVVPDLFNVVRFGTSTDRLDNAVQMVGRMQNVVMEYTLLSRSKGMILDEEDVRRLLYNQLIYLGADEEFNECLINNGGCEDVCINLVGSFRCDCYQENTVLSTDQMSCIDSFNVFGIGLDNISTLPDLIPNWYNYLYDGGSGSISDGGRDMYDGGNYIMVYRNEIGAISVIYNRSYRFDDYSFTTAAVHPFIAWLNVSNPVQERLNFTIRVLGDAGADGRGNIILYNGSINQGNYHCQYFVFQVGNAGRNPSICEVYALFDNPEDWGSVVPDLFNVVHFETSTNTLDNAVQMVGRMQNVNMEYTLLSRSNGLIIEEELVRRVLSNQLVFLGADAEMNECLINNGGCEDVCINLIGSFRCACSRERSVLSADQVSCIDSFDVFGIGLDNISTLPGLIPNWYNYLYDGGDGFIQDGGGDMYDGGNYMIVYRNEIEAISVIYNQTYRFDDYSFTTAAVHPFIAWLNISNPVQERLNFTLRVHGNAGADGRGNITRYNGSINEGNYHCQYFVFQVGNAGDSSICEVYALFANPEDWGSVVPDLFNVVRFGTSTNTLDNAVQMVGRMQNVNMEYTLLSRLNGMIVDEELVRNVLSYQLVFLGADAEINECLINNGGCEDVCINLIGSFRCACSRENTLLSENQRSCEVDENECLINNGGCEDVCIDIIGSFRCSCSRERSYLSADQRSCIDAEMNECLVNNGGCEDVCINLIGSFRCACSQENTFLSENQRSCEDSEMNECLVNNGGCEDVCINLIGSFRCACSQENTFLSENQRSCEDLEMNECLVNNGGCEDVCINLIGSFRCACSQENTFLSENQRSCEDPQIPFCPIQTIALNNLAVTFGRRYLYETGVSIEICEETGSPLASATCLPTPNFASNGEVVGEFDESTVIFIECGVRIANITNSTIESLPTLSVLTSASEVLTETDIATATEILESYLNQSEPQQINEAILGLATRTISNLFAGESLTRRNRSDTNRTVEIKSQLLQTLNGFAASVELPPDTEFTEVITPDITVQVRSLPEGESFSENGLVFNLTNFRTSSNVEATVFAGTMTSSNRNRRSTDNSSATMDNRPTVFATLLGSQYPISSNQNTSQVVSVGIRNTSMTNLSVEITFEVDYPLPEMKVKENPVKRQLNQASFVRWDFEAMRWTTSVCDGAPPSRTFQCSQLASYSILFSRRIVPSIAALAIVSYIGSALSIIFLLLTIFIYVSQKELRDNPTTMTLVNICVCLVGVYLLFAIGVGRVSHHQTCNALTFLLHYFTLACLSWMTVNAYQMLRAFTSLTYSIKRARFAFYVLAYGIPFIIVLFNFALTVLFLDRQQEPNDPEDINYESLYRARFTCWLQEPSFYWGFILPMGILLLFNIVVFIILLKKVVFRKREVRSSAKDRPLVERLVNAITMIVMMGLTWIFGYFLLIPANVAYETAMQWLFTIFNVLQGAVIFYLYCLRRKNIRSVWFKYRPSRFIWSESSTSGTSRTGKSRSTSATEEYTKITTNI